MPYRKTLLFFLLPATMISQNITGKIYDSESTVKGAKIFNKTKNTTAYSDANGSFNLPAALNDTITISSLFHATKTLKVDTFHVENELVIELKKQVNQLPEVLLADKQNDLKTFETNSDLGAVLAYDLKNNTETWYKNMPKSGIDFVQVSKLIGKLLKLKKKKPVEITTINHKTFDSLFATHKFFNAELLANQLEIPEGYAPLFFDYCEEQYVNSELLLEKNEFMLLDKLLNCSRDFRELLKTTETD
ncbi:CarboxypepD_reg-like domain-containing protein [Algibacter lectus]|uniref:carboxypeptidase-like regulatory domain-containing protein n=1 Tax=Algibacter lectus TaxID=221126 RepID=UPI0008DEDF16|nr:carboxypeptidase-like regulatory domain-containing protein [Algibacter lectus]SFD10778.1 CarboxypepD_reg-like domain-containing protein [Algibacter lectus]